MDRTFGKQRPAQAGSDQYGLAARREADVSQPDVAMRGVCTFEGGERVAQLQADGSCIMRRKAAAAHEQFLQRRTGCPRAGDPQPAIDAFVSVRERRAGMRQVGGPIAIHSQSFFTGDGNLRFDVRSTQQESGCGVAASRAVVREATVVAGGLDKQKRPDV